MALLGPVGCRPSGRYQAKSRPRASRAPYPDLFVHALDQLPRLLRMQFAPLGKSDPGVLALAPDGIGRRREGGVGEVAGGDADRIGRGLGIPIDGAAAHRTEEVVEPA